MNAPPVSPPIRVIGAAAGNLKGFDLEIPTQQLVCVTGPSGAGKSSLLLGTLLAESDSRISLLKNLRTGSLQRLIPPANSTEILQLPPTQLLNTLKGVSKDTTVGSFLGIGEELYQTFLRTGKRNCVQCQGEIQQTSLSEICDGIAYNFMDQKITLSALPRDEVTPEEIIAAGFEEHDVSNGFTMVVIDRISVCESGKQRVREAVITALHLKRSDIMISSDENTMYYSAHSCCSSCGYRAEPISADTFNLRDPIPEEIVLKEELESPVAGLSPYRRLHELSHDDLTTVTLQGALSDKVTRHLLIVEEPATEHVTELKALVDNGNTVIYSSSNQEMAEAAEHLIALGPMSGAEGGEVVYQGPPPAPMELHCEAHTPNVGEASIPSTSFVAGYLGLYRSIQEHYSKLQLSRMYGYTRKDFAYDPRKEHPFSEKVLQVVYKGFSVKQLLERPFHEVSEVIAALPKCGPILKKVQESGLDYLPLGQQTQTLSSGELTRVRSLKDTL